MYIYKCIIIFLVITTYATENILNVPNKNIYITITIFKDMFLNVDGFRKFYIKVDSQLEC